MKLFSTWLSFIAIKYKMIMEYKGAFWAASVSQILWYGVDFLLIWVLVLQFKNLAGWSADEIIFLYSIQLFTYAVAGTFFFTCILFFPYFKSLLCASLEVSPTFLFTKYLNSPFQYCWWQMPQ